jgi:polysaccharide export outer membrane protein
MKYSGKLLAGWAGLFAAVWLGAWVVMVSSATAVGAETNQVAKVDQLQVGDVVKITLSGPPEWNGKPPFEQKVKDDGTISLDYVGVIKAAGKNAAQLELDIQAAFVPKYYKRLSVLVVTDNRFFYVNGIVKAPGRYPHVSELTVTKAIAAAGGFTEFSKKTAVTITRLDGKVETIDCKKADKDPKLDKPVYPGDIINVDRRLF